MKISRAAIKQNAKLQMREAKPHACIVALVYFVIVWVLSLLSGRVSGVPIRELSAAIERAMEAMNPEIIMELYARYQNFWGELISLIISIVEFIIGIGFMIYALNVSRMRQAGIANLLDGFGMFLRAIWLCILIAIFVFLWSLLFVFPGIIAAYRYRQAYFILIDNPNMRAIDCIRMSKQMMKGHKWELFVLDLSFIGWAILCVIPFVTIWVTPYMEVTNANYYLALLGIQNADAPDANAPQGGDTPPWEQQQ